MRYEEVIVLERIRADVLAGNYLITEHAKLKMIADGLITADVESALLTGTMERIFTQHARGTRYQIVGTACDLSTRVAVIVRLEETAIVVTVYELKR